MDTWKLLIITVVLPILASGGIGTLSGSPLFEFQPDFDAYVEDILSNGVSEERITINNVGWEQATNAEVTIFAKNNIMIKEKICPEGKFVDVKNSTEFTLKFDRLSDEITCIVYFTNDFKEKQINHVFVTADDASGYEWYPGKPRPAQQTIQTLQWMFVIAISIPVGYWGYALTKYVLKKRQKRASHMDLLQYKDLYNQISLDISTLKKQLDDPEFDQELIKKQIEQKQTSLNSIQVKIQELLGLME